MSKYSNKFKLKVIEYCINEHHGYQDAEKHFGVNHEYLRTLLFCFLNNMIKADKKT